MPEAPVTFSSHDGVPLEGRLHVPAGAGPHPAVVVCHPHPLMGGTMHDRVVLAVVRALHARAVAALRFNFRSHAPRGLGIAEQGEARPPAVDEEAAGDVRRPSVDEEAADDVAGAFDFLATQPTIAEDRLALAGYSFGAGVVARYAPEEPQARALALIALPGWDLSPDLLAGYERPVCIVVGDRDQFSPTANMRAFVASLVAPTTLHVLPGVDHFFGRGLDRMGTLVADFLADQVNAS